MSVGCFEWAMNDNIQIVRKGNPLISNSPLSWLKPLNCSAGSQVEMDDGQLGQKRCRASLLPNPPICPNINHLNRCLVNEKEGFELAKQSKRPIAIQYVLIPSVRPHKISIFCASQKDQIWCHPANRKLGRTIGNRGAQMGRNPTEKDKTSVDWTAADSG